MLCVFLPGIRLVGTVASIEVGFSTSGQSRRSGAGVYRLRPTWNSLPAQSDKLPYVR